jgi:hypothetical protein
MKLLVPLTRVAAGYASAFGIFTGVYGGARFLGSAAIADHLPERRAPQGLLVSLR